MSSVSVPIVNVHEGDPSSVHRLLFVIPHMELGGADKWNLELIERLSRDYGYLVSIVTTNPSKNAWIVRFREITSDIHVLPGFLEMRAWPRFITNLMKSRRTDVVLVSNSRFGYDIAPYLKAIFPKTPIVDYVHMEEPERRDGGYAINSILHSTSISLTGVTSNHLRDWMIVAGGDASKIRTVYINVDERKWSRDVVNESAVRQKWALNSDIPVVLYACRLVAQKQPEVFVETATRLIESGLKVQFVIVGEGPGESQIRRLVSKYPQCVRWVGKRSPDEVRELLCCSDILFIPSKHEGIALAYYEAMSMGVVPVGADVGGQGELITPECGLLLPRGGNEASAYAKAISELLGNRCRLDAMKTASRQRILARFTFDRMVSDMIGMFRDAALSELKTMPVELADAYADQVVERHRLAMLTDRLWADSDESFTARFRYSRISPRLSVFKRGLLRFIMKHL